MRDVALMDRIPYSATPAGARAATLAMQARSEEPVEMRSLQERRPTADGGNGPVVGPTTGALHGACRDAAARHAPEDGRGPSAEY